MRNLLEFNTIDNTSIKDSLVKHGLIAQNHKSDSYFCIYKHDSTYEIGFASESEIAEFLDGKSWISKKIAKKFLADIKLEKETFFNLPFIYKLHCILKYFGVQDFMGKKVYEMDIDEALEHYWGAVK